MFYKLTTLENLRHDNLYSGPHTMVPSSSCLVISLSVLVNALSHFFLQTITRNQLIGLRSLQPSQHLVAWKSICSESQFEK